MKKIFIIIIISLSIVNCSVSSIEEKNDLVVENLKGLVKSVKTSSYTAIDKFGDITKGNELVNELENGKKEFNRKGFLIKNNYNNYRIDNKNSFFDVNEIYSYDSFNRILEIKTINKQGKLNSKRIFTYNIDGKILESKDYNLKGEINYKSSFIYEYTDNLTKIKRFDRNGAVNFITHQKFDSNNNIVLEETIAILPNDSREKRVYNYNNNKLVEEIYNNGEHLYSYRKFSYNENGNHSNVISKNKRGEIILKEVFKYKYDSYDNWINKIIITEDFPKKIIVREIKYY